MRLRILSDDEIDTLYGRPCFTEGEREEHFALSAEENAALAQLHSIKSRMFFILQLGYFKARRMFFTFSLRDVEEDAAHIRQKYFLSIDIADAEIAEGTRLKHQKLILRACLVKFFLTQSSFIYGSPLSGANHVSERFKRQAMGEDFGIFQEA